MQEIVVLSASFPDIHCRVIPGIRIGPLPSRWACFKLLLHVMGTYASRYVAMDEVNKDADTSCYVYMRGQLWEQA